MKKTFFAAATLVAALPFLASAQDFPAVDDTPADTRFDRSLNFDVLGIRPGNTQEEVRAKLKELFPDDNGVADVRMQGNVASPNGAQVKIDFVSELRRRADSGQPPLYRKGKAADWPIVYFSSPIYGSRAAGVERSLYFGPEEMMSAEAMRVTVEEKYGRPTITNKDVSGHVTSVAYFYAGGKLLPETGWQHANCSNGAGDCGSFISGYEPRNGTPVKALKAKEPCAAMAEWVYQGKGAFDYKFNDIVIYDESCDGIMTVNFNGDSPAKLDWVVFGLYDVKRLYGHRVALDAAITKELQSPTSAPASAKPRL